MTFMASAGRAMDPWSWAGPVGGAVGWESGSPLQAASEASNSRPRMGDIRETTRFFISYLLTPTKSVTRLPLNSPESRPATAL